MADTRSLEAALATLAPLGDRAVPGGALGALTTYRVGGVATVLVTARARGDLALVGEAVRASGVPVLVVGRGSNLLVADRGFAGIAVLLDTDVFGRVSISGTSVTAGSAVALPALARQTVDAGLTGFEWAVGVPGSVGGGVRMNAGGHGSDMSACVVWCEVANLSGSNEGVERRTLTELEYGYRTSSVRPDEVVVSAGLALSRGDRERSRAAIREIVRWRREHQPGGQNAGSVFTNPPGDSAGRIIEEAGLKGRRWGSAMVSQKHANFIQADPGGSADDVRRLIDVVRDEVSRRTGVLLHTEVKMVGFSDPQPQLKRNQLGTRSRPRLEAETSGEGA